MKDMAQQKRSVIFIATAYGISFLLGILMWYGNRKQADISTFPAAQMFYPAAGVMAGILWTKKEDKLIPRMFYWFFILVTVLMAVMAVVSVFFPYTVTTAMVDISVWAILQQYLMIVASVAGWIILLATKKEKRRAYGLGWNAGRASFGCILLFFVLYMVRSAAAVTVSGQLSVFLDVVRSPMTWIQLALLPINFFLLFSAFFGEEYGWRYHLQPFLQERFGLRGGVLVLGVVWGLWHLPIDLFYYTQETPFLMVLAQQITCLSLSIFFAYAYMKTENIWVPVAMHFMNNNLIPIISGNYSASVLEGQTVTWGELLTALVLNGLVFGWFLLAKPFRKGPIAEKE